MQSNALRAINKVYPTYPFNLEEYPHFFLNTFIPPLIQAITANNEIKKNFISQHSKIKSNSFELLAIS